MTCVLALRNRQRARAVDMRLFRRIVIWALEGLFNADRYELGIHLISSTEMAAMNETYLRHAGSTDVITFNYGAGARDGSGVVQWSGGSGPIGKSPKGVSEDFHGEIFISLDDAVKQGRAFGVGWESEIVRYLLHGLLHLRGFDDRSAELRRAMKREENRLLKLVERRFKLARLSRRRS
ncbi:MAG: putative rRNA maturation factor [Verrucomicrobiota bacterium]|jgi:probable rRNA maturation factor